MTEIKICGMTNIEDARFAAESGVDALGFIFYPKSPRYVQPKTAWDIIRKLPPEVAKTGVFVNHDTQDIKEIMEYCGLNFIQLHGNESPEYCRYFPESVIIKALSPRTEEDLNILEEYQARAILVDTYAPEKHGGTGKISNWELAVKIRKRRPLILSGGLNPDNIEDAIKKVLPHAVDINSGVEKIPGKKDHGLVMKIINLVRQCDTVHDNKQMKIFCKGLDLRERITE